MTNKTTATNQSVTAHLKTVAEKFQADANALLQLFKDATGVKPKMWGNMVGYGTYHYKYDSGREGDFFATGFAIRKTGPTIYIMPGYADYSDLLAKLGPHKLGKSCLYLKHVADIDEKILTRLIKKGLKDLKMLYPVTMK